LSKTDDNKDNKSFKHAIWEYFSKSVRRDLLVDETVNDVVSNNAKVVILTLFGLILISIILYSFLLTGKFNPDSPRSGIQPDIFGLNSLEKTAYNDILISNVSAEEKIQRINNITEIRLNEFQDRFQQIEQIDAVFIAAITGAVALGGTLITQLWARRQP
jgi:hypothetical protein